MYNSLLLTLTGFQLAICPLQGGNQLGDFLFILNDIRGCIVDLLNVLLDAIIYFS